MDVTFSLTRITEEVGALIEEGDFEGAEEYLSARLACEPRFQCFIHYQLGRLYRRWNKLSSAIQHFNQAIEGALADRNEIFVAQILEELNLAKSEQRSQKP